MNGNELIELSLELYGRHTRPEIEDLLRMANNGLHRTLENEGSREEIEGFNDQILLLEAALRQKSSVYN